jgi:hypothetical protein
MCAILINCKMAGAGVVDSKDSPPGRHLLLSHPPDPSILQSRVEAEESECNAPASASRLVQEHCVYGFKRRIRLVG